jgi:hypothetical protein
VNIKDILMLSIRGLKVLREKKGSEDDSHFGYLREMSYACVKGDGYGIIIEVNGNDHGKIGNQRSPAHAHIYDTNKNVLGEIVITQQRPLHPSEVVEYRSKLPDGIRKVICEWAKNYRKIGNNWEYLKELWDTRNPDL